MFPFVTFPISDQNLTETVKMPAYAEMNAKFPFKPVAAKLGSYFTSVCQVMCKFSESK